MDPLLHVFASTMLLVAAALGRQALRRRSAAARHLVWLLAFWTLALLPLAGWAPVDGVPVDWVLPELPFGSSRLLYRTTVTAGDQAAGGLPAAMVPASFSRLALGVWAAGGGLMLVHLAASLVRLGQLRRSTPGRHPILRRAPHGTMPFTFGHFRPLIFLPAEAAAWPAARRRHVVLHELAHIRRHDYAAHLFARCVLAFYWWHPLAWYAWRHLAAERELAADDSVLRRGVRPSDYAESLLCVAAALPPARFALGMARRVPLEGRLRSILAVKTVRTAPGRLATAAAALACVVAVLPIATLRGQNQNPAALTQGLDALQRKEYEEAFSRFAGLDPAGAALWQALTRERQGRAAEAAERFDRAVALAMGDDKAESVALRLYDRFLAADAARPGARQAVQARLAELEARHRAALARQTPGAEVRRVGGGVIAPRLLEKVQPLYSQEARGAKLEGTVVLSVEIDAAGRPGNIRILRGVGLGLDENAREALARWRFEPGRAEGRAVPVAATVEVNFKLLD